MGDAEGDVSTAAQNCGGYLTNLLSSTNFQYLTSMVDFSTSLLPRNCLEPLQYHVKRRPCKMVVHFSFSLPPLDFLFMFGSFLFLNASLAVAEITLGLV